VISNQSVQISLSRNELFLQSVKRKFAVALMSFRKIRIPIPRVSFLHYLVPHCKGSCHERQKPYTPTLQAPIRNRRTRKVANAKGLNLLTLPYLTKLNLT